MVGLDLGHGLGQLGELLFQLGGWNGAAQVVALGDVAAERRQLLPGVLGLDAFGDHPQSQVVAEVDGGPHDDGVAGAGRHLADERAVDLQLVYRELLQVGHEE
jgi:hypothetical protein